MRYTVFFLFPPLIYHLNNFYFSTYIIEINFRKKKKWPNFQNFFLNYVTSFMYGTQSSGKRKKKFIYRIKPHACMHACMNESRQKKWIAAQFVFLARPMIANAKRKVKWYICVQNSNFVPVVVITVTTVNLSCFGWSIFISDFKIKIVKFFVKNHHYILYSFILG